jgi:hypothetical protein
VRVVQRFLAQRRDDFAQSPAAASPATSALSENVEHDTDRAVWTALARALINTDEFITRE